MGADNTFGETNLNPENDDRQHSISYPKSLQSKHEDSQGQVA